MIKETDDQMKVECTECSFTRIVEADEDVLPAEIVREHGKKTGHTLSVTRIGE